MIYELYSWRFFDVFEFNVVKKYWVCFMCNYLEKMCDLMKNGVFVIVVGLLVVYYMYMVYCMLFKVENI